MVVNPAGRCEVDGAVPRNHDGHLVAEVAERGGERADDVRQPAGLGPRGSFGGNHQDARHEGI